MRTSYNFVDRHSFDPPTIPEIFKKIGLPEIEKFECKYLSKIQLNSRYGRHRAKFFSPLDRSRGPLSTSHTPS